MIMWWRLRALRAERRARRAERSATLAQHLAVAAIKRLSDDALVDLRNEMGEGARYDSG